MNLDATIFKGFALQNTQQAYPINVVSEGGQGWVLWAISTSWVADRIENQNRYIIKLNAAISLAQCELGVAHFNFKEPVLF